MAPASSSTNKDENQSSRKTAAAAASAARPQELQAQKCPRCDSPNTKFCYYNNYSLTQPRHFCKTCRRYWTKGGALRNVPIGGGCRKNKRNNKLPSSSTATSSSSRLNLDPNKDMLSSSATDIGGLKFFHGFTPAMDFQLGGLTSNFPRTSTPPNLYGGTSQISSFGDMMISSTTSSSTPLMGFNFPFPSSMLMKQGVNSTEVHHHHHHHQEMMIGGHPLNNPPPPPPHHTSSLASSIENLSSMNQDLHWKLQQQRLAMLFGGDNNQNQNQHQKEGNIDISSIPLGNHEVPHEKVQPILFHNLEIAAPPKTNTNDHHCGGGAVGGDDNNLSSRSGNNLSTEWFFDSSYAPVTPQNPTPTNSSSHGNGNGNDHHDENMNNWNGIPAWTNMSQYSAL